MRAVIYLRVSSDAQVDGYGLAVQEQSCRAFAKRVGLTVIAVEQDEGVSGTKDAHERPALTAALASIRNGDADALLVARLDRLARSLTVQEAILAEVWRSDGQLFTADQGKVLKDDPDDPMRTAMRQMAGVFAQLDRALTVKRMADGRRAKKAQGGKAEGSYPYGWGKDGEIEEEQRVLYEVRHLRDQGLTWEQVADRLNASRLRPRTATRWTARNAAKVLQPSP